ncbi:hypothetical protein [Haliea sp.]|uniref:hypothetical protein n=1 Tax=Haliea sp. TaxID=1932666 RepID=UPI003529CEF6
MSYHCRQCSYRGNRLDERGYCPACGSPDIHIGGKAAVKAPPKPRKRQLALVIALWVIFAGLLASKLVS